MQTGENEQGLRKIIDFIRLLSIVVLLFHFYQFLYPAMRHFGLTAEVIDRVVEVVTNTGLFTSVHTTKFTSFSLLAISLIGAKGKKDEKARLRGSLVCLIAGSLLFFLSHALLQIKLQFMTLMVTYVVVTSLGFILMLTGGTWLSYERNHVLRFQKPF